MENNVTIISRLRNEELILPDFLNHIDKIGNEFYFFDDDSTDNTIEILKSHPKTKKVLKNEFWVPSQSFAQTNQRKFLLEYAKNNAKNDWLMLIEPDERVEVEEVKSIDFSKYLNNGIKFKLFDGYLTEETGEPYTEGRLWDTDRMWGPEYREIGYLFKKNNAFYPSDVPNVRQPSLTEGDWITEDVLVKHFGKCLSIKHWEETCDFYIKTSPILANKWKKRKDKAIHTKSDFSRDLYTWEELKQNQDKWIKI